MGDLPSMICCVVYSAIADMMMCEKVIDGCVFFVRIIENCQ